jgi:hypothetical protein
MKRYLMTLALGCLPLAAVELDTAAVGRDLNGWNDQKVAWFGTDGLSFRANTPEVRPLENGAVEILMKVEEVAKRVSVYTAEVRLVVSSDGLVRAAQISGKVDGVDFTSGEVTRPEVAVTSAPAEGEAVDVTPVNAEAEMQSELAQVLDSAIEQARKGKMQARRDVAARFFGSKAGESASLSKATGIVVKSLFRRVGR